MSVSPPPPSPLSSSFPLERFFSFVVNRPRSVIVFFGLVVAFFAYQLPGIRFDNRPNSFIPPQHEALLSKEKIETLFGLEDPMLVAVDTGQVDGIFQAKPLRLIEELTRKIEAHLEEEYPGQAPAHPVYSLATEHDVDVFGGVPHEKPFLEPFPATPEDSQRLKDAVFRLELYDGVIVSEEGRAGAIVVMPPPGQSQAVNRYLLDLLKRKREELSSQPGNRLQLVLAGETAVRSSMGDAVVHDAVLLNPVCAGVVTLFLFLAFRNLAGIVLPLAIVGSGSIIMLGLMILCDKPVYIITNSILVTVMSLGVADAIHVQGQYYKELGVGGFSDRRELILRTMRRLWIPILTTSVTDIAGFLSFLFTGTMPPLEWFGFFTAVGVGATLLASMTLLPACLTFLDPQSPRHQRRKEWAVTGPLARLLAKLGTVVFRHPRAVAATCGGVVLLALLSATRLQVDQSMVSAFDEEHEIVQADRLVNSLFHGTYFLDVLLEAEEPGTFLKPEVLRKIDALEKFATSFSDVKGSLSVVGFARKMNEIMSEWDATKNVIPGDADTVERHFTLIHDFSPTKKADLLRVVDKDYQTANVRLRLCTGWFTRERVVLEALQGYLDEHFAAGGPLKATLSGRVNIDYHWVKLIVRSHIASVGCALLLIFLLLLIQFRFAFTAAAFCLVPVGAAILATYGVMAAAGIQLSIGTSMFACLAMGVGVNFPIHVVHRLRIALAQEKRSESDAYRELFSVTGKALCFNAMAVCFGFLALFFSDLPLLRHFGLMIALGIGTACLASLTLLPALTAWRRPRFIYR